MCVCVHVSCVLICLLFLGYRVVRNATIANLPESPDYDTVLKMLKDVREMIFRVNILCFCSQHCMRLH